MSFELNRDFIAGNLCENRDRPSLNCNGKCYLAKKIQVQQNREDRQTTERVQNLLSIALFCNDLFSFNFDSGNSKWATPVALGRIVPGETRLG